MSNSEKQTLVEEGTEFTGTLRARCKVVVRGSVDGELEAPAVDVAAGGSVTGNVRAQKVDSRGVIAGSVEADDVSLAGEVKSDTVIRAKSLSVKLAAEQGRLEVTFGDTILEVGDMPSDRPAATEQDEDETETIAPPARLQAAPSPSQSSTSAGTEAENEDDDDDDDARHAEGATAPAR
jgi:cytoskeletal protein CcmA (bactofilin family)